MEKLPNNDIISDGATRRGQWLVFAGVVVIVAACLTAYIPALRAGFIWDDDSYVEDNETLRSADGLRRIWFEPGVTHDYYPLTFTTLWLEYHFWQLSPFGYHLNNILLHALNALLLWRLLVRLRIPGAWLAAAVFALHPVHVESVAWITERKNVLSTMFYLLSFHAFLRFNPPQHPGPNWRRQWPLLVLSLALYLLAMLSKITAVTLPAMFVIVLWWKHSRFRRSDIIAVVPYLLAAVPLFVLAFWTHRHFVRPTGERWDFTFLQRCLIAGRVLWFYVGKLIWPATLTFIYPRWHIDAGVWWQYLFVPAAAAVPVTAWLARRWIGRAPLAAVLFYGLTLFPVWGFFNIYWQLHSFVADHAQYIASMAPIVLIVALTSRTAAQLSPAARNITRIAALLILAILATLTWKQCHIYKDRETLWRDTLEKNPDSWLAHKGLAYELQPQGKLLEAIEHWREVVRLKPQARYAHYNLGRAFITLGRLDQALEHFRHTLRIDPNAVPAHNNLGTILLAQGEIAPAIEHFRAALRIDARLPGTHNNLGIALQLQGKNAQAIASYRNALRIDPDFIRSLDSLAWILVTCPDGTIRDPVEAVTLAHRACALTDYTNPKTLETLAAAYAANGQFDKAVHTAQNALQLAVSTNQIDLAHGIRRHLLLYRAHRPYREE